MAELHYAFIKNNHVENVLVFSEQNEELANQIVSEKGYDFAVWVGENNPSLYSSYDGVSFTPATLDYLYEIGVSTKNQAMVDAEKAAAEAANN